MMRRRTAAIGAAALALLIGAGVTVLPVRGQVGDNLTPQGDFEKPDANGKPAGWELISPEGLQIVQENGSRILRVTNSDPAKAVAIQKSVPLPPGTRVVVVSARMKTTNLALGKEGWHEPRIALRFENDQGQQAGGYPAMPNLRANSPWVTRQVVLDVPDGATRLVMQPGLWLATGTLDLDDIEVRPYRSGGEYMESQSRPIRDGFPEGKFEETDARGGPAGWTLPGSDTAAVVTVDNGKALRVTSSEPNGDLYATGTFRTDPKWATLGVKLRARVTGYRPGDYGWKQARIVAVLYDGNGRQIRENGLANWSGNADWQEHTAKLDLPEETRYIRFQAGWERAAGNLEIDHILLEPAGEAPLADAALPANAKLDWGGEKIETISATRARASLNGIWKFVPAEGPAAKDPKAGWGYIRVPGNWKNDGDIVARGQGRMWQNYNGDKVNQVWYERTIRVPRDWNGRAVLLDFDRVSTDAEVFVNGQSAGQIRWPAGTIDITRLVKLGEDASLRMRVVAVDDRSQVEVYMGYLQTEMKPAQLDNKGIIGDVTLRSRPLGGYVYDVFVRPSTRQKKLFVDLELGGIAQAGTLELTARMLDEKGNAEKTFTSTVPVKAAEMQKVTAAWDWPDPRLWEVGKPTKYVMLLDVKGAGVADQYVQDFGFREFWIAGTQFYLNGSPFPLRPGVLQYGAMPSERFAQGHNFGEIWPERNTRRGSRPNDDALIADAETIGMPISGNALFMADFIGKGWETDAVKADFRRQVELQMRRWRNKPSIVMWGTSGNALGTDWGDSNPWTIGDPSGNAVQEQLFRRERVREATAIIHEIDPTRPVFGHHSDNGEVHTSNMYLNFIPLQEREEWLSQWARAGKLPWMAVEFGPPLYASLMRGRDGYDHQGKSEPFLSEWTAVYLGSEAYKLEPAEYRTRIIRDRYKGSDRQSEYEPHIRNNGGDRVVSESASYSKLLDLFYTNTWRSWRTMGVSGGMVPWHHDRHPALQRVNGSSLAWIAGAGPAPVPGDDGKPAWTEKDHSFRTGQIIEKQIVLINDHREPMAYSAQWEAGVAGKRLAGETKTGTLKVGEILFLPIKIATPSVVTGGKAEGTITLAAKIGPDAHQDALRFHVFAPEAPERGTLTVFDPAGETTALLKRLGYTVKPWAGGQPEGALVIGRKALSDKNLLPGDLEVFVRGGGRAIVFGQEANWTKYALQMRTAPHLSRRVFRIDPAHPVVRGLDDLDLSDWAGASRMVASHPHYPGYQWTYSYGWHWGNRGAVSSTPIEKPHRSSWRPLLESEFDLAYTPLMEMDYGKGRLVFCTLDLEDHAAVDPAADRLARQVMEYVRTAPLAPKSSKVVYVGDDAGAKTLDFLGVVYTRATGIDPAAGLIVVGAAPGVSDADLQAYAQKGGKLLFLHRRQESGGLGTKLGQVKDFVGSVSVPAWPEARGLSASDLRWRSLGDAWVLQPSGGVETGGDGQLGRMKIGQGVVIFAQVDPSAVPADEKRYFRFTRWRQTRALSQLLANLGATFAQDRRTMALLQRPQQAWMLAGIWDAQLTDARPEKVSRDLPDHQWNPDPAGNDPAKIGERARSLVVVDPAPTAWEKVLVPAYQESYGGKWRFTDGEAVYRKVIDIPAYLAGKDMFLSLGRIDESEITFFNGEAVGKSRSWLWPRGHIIPGRLVKAGRNTIAIRTWDEGIHGGWAADPAHIYLRALGENAGLYHDDYIDDDIPVTDDEKVWSDRVNVWKIADNPYRYYRW